MRGAFTLIELLVAVLLLGLVAGVAMVSLDGISARTRLEATSRCLEQAFRLARSEAIASGLPRRLVLEPQAHQAVIHRLRIGPEGWVWTAGPHLAWSEHVTLALGDDMPAASKNGSPEEGQILLCIWPDGVGQARQLHLQEADQRMDVTIDGLSVMSRWIPADGKDAQARK
jgi:type II secretion system protein H